MFIMFKLLEVFFMIFLKVQSISAVIKYSFMYLNVIINII